jgi:hypothetical protein
MAGLRRRSQRRFVATLRLRVRDLAVRRGLFDTGNEWRIGVGSFTSLDDLPELADAPMVLTWADVCGVSASFVADPFLFEWQGRKYLFMEVLDADSQKGLIGWAKLDDDGFWRFGGIALEERFHLSYPHVFESDGEVFMVPETSEDGSVHLYRASSFPSHWEHRATLLQGAPFSDASLVKHDGLWWMFVETSSGPHFDTLRLFLSARLEGPWVEHRCSPIVKGDAQASRPAGPPVWIHGRLIRFAQDCHEVYGRAVFGFEVVRLTPTTYEERPLGTEPLLSGRGSGWNGQGMHHISVLQQGEQWLAAVDGYAIPGIRLPALPALRQRSGRRGSMGGG